VKWLILDHLRRWRWVLASGAVYAFVLGWCIALPADYGQGWPGDHLFWLVWLKVHGRLFVTEILVLATWMGTILLSFDLQRGLVRAIRSLPLTGRQIGRGWWLATVGIPAVTAIALMFLGAAAFCLFHPGQPFPLARLILADVLSVLWFGSGFAVYLNKPTVGVWGEDRKTVLVNLLGTALVTGLVVWMVFGFALSLDAAKSPVKCGVFFAAGALLTTLGLLRAEELYSGRVGQLGVEGPKGLMPSRGRSALTSLTSAETCDLAPSAHCPGAISFLMRTISARIFLIVLVVVAYAGLILRLEGVIDTWEGAVRCIGGLASAFWVIIFFQVTPVVQHLRFLRTLPISASGLAALLMTIGMLPLLALGVLVASAAWPICGSSSAITILGTYAFTLAPAALCIAFAVWRGGGLSSSAFLLFILLGAFAMSGCEIPLPFSGLMAAGCVVAGFLLTRRALHGSPRVYLSRNAPENPVGTVAWDAGG